MRYGSATRSTIAVRTSDPSPRSRPSTRPARAAACPTASARGHARGQDRAGPRGLDAVGRGREHEAQRGVDGETRVAQAARCPGPRRRRPGATARRCRGGGRPPRPRPRGRSAAGLRRRAGAPRSALAAKAPATAEAALPPRPPESGRPFTTRSSRPTPAAPACRSTSAAARAAVLRAGSHGIRAIRDGRAPSPRGSRRAPPTRGRPSRRSRCPGSRSRARRSTWSPARSR